ncbi:MAG TPA: TldD/PmbA family protein [Candidatus Eremiobacteraceae bacterium]|nr:TldD/PmbA family protein [Candidatus Eremiobacteraceae bacterium]
MRTDLAAERAAADAVLDAALRDSTADETEAIVMAQDYALSRIMGNTIHENLVERNRTLSVRAVVGKRIGVATSNDLDGAGIRTLVDRACEIARLSPADQDFPGLPTSGPATSAMEFAYDEATAATTAAERAGAVAKIVSVMKKNDLDAAGYVSTSAGSVAIANSKGIRQFFRSTDSAINIKAMSADSSGYAEGHARQFGDLDASALASTAAQKAVAGRTPGSVDPGEYTVILEPPALREFLGYLSWTGFGAMPFAEGASFMSGHIGERVMGANVTIADDFAHPLGDGMPFDFEGVSRKPVTLVEQGVARDVVYDSYYAAKLKHANTGHALPAPNTYGPLPLNVVVSPGQKSAAQLIAETKRGLLVSRTWYIRLVDKLQTIITGMTRDGFFLIEDGRITRGLRNMRFNESIVGALGRCELANDLVRSENHVVPACRIEGFHFSSGTTF